jgi:hypothetical protein
VTASVHPDDTPVPETPRLALAATVSIAGIARARKCATKSGKAIGRPKVDPKIENAIRTSLSRGVGILKTARELQVGSGTVQRLKSGDAGSREVKACRIRPWGGRPYRERHDGSGIMGALMILGGRISRPRAVSDSIRLVGKRSRI